VDASLRRPDRHDLDVTELADFHACRADRGVGILGLKGAVEGSGSQVEQVMPLSAKLS
jgi:hypothetical protein